MTVISKGNSPFIVSGVGHSATDDTIVSGGTMLIESGGVASGTTVSLQPGKGCAHHLGKLVQAPPASSYWCHAACLARKRPRASFPSLAASAMLSKKPGEHSTNPERPAR